MDDTSQASPRNAGFGPEKPRRGRKKERGQALLEFAIVMPIFLVLLMGIVDFGLGLRAWISITNSAREGARIASVHATCDSIINRVEDSSGGLVTSSSQVTIDPSDCDFTSGDPVTVTVEYTYNLVTPLGGMLGLLGGGIPSSIHISSTSNMRVE
ncbi:MAG TPA: TadE/TadG family type IV pilus assembly protein [Dehalococcoidia bacterium]|nr:TadE/TadG family type IV pilus assembly protein [Dehalococcoidia bacterium]